MVTFSKYLILLSAQGKISLVIFGPVRMSVISGDMMALPALRFGVTKKMFVLGSRSKNVRDYSE